MKLTSRSSSAPLLATLVWAFLSLFQVGAATEMFLRIPGVEGESQDKDHKNEIEVLSWSWRASNIGSPGSATFTGFSVVKFIDKATPDLMLNVANGEHLTEATLNIRRSGSSPFDYITVAMNDVIVTAVSTGGASGEVRLTENVDFSFGEVKVTYVPSPSLPKEFFRWNIATNQGESGTEPGGGPRPVTGLSTTVSHSNGSPTATLSWENSPGSWYQVWATSDLNTPFVRFGVPVTWDGDGMAEITLPAEAAHMFFIIESLPNP